ncbi:cyclopropane-fatty-acyl-phospholipid synthase family protein [Mesobacterium sp. TK19101]|uniref:Cyclopropane-fatty-acyl-phospholipid synthase family protein n=1 Tax=Mesobacterium hydrothermale TaxID=3111907 RepID=A0ABU6HEV9_9RHOB|nr:cyclopropane-fatty-acyl-phospholipid synthase family protein [Mesobacterium sp. TK19101]MEC3860199.1 cyclopropane-fatty-acyl-phospholipid synthase family protein [Mesobacterium sp. TK19101]
MAITAALRTDKLGQTLLRRVEPFVTGRMTVCFSDGQEVVLANGRPGRVSAVHIHDMAVFRRIALGGWVGACDAYIDGMWSTPDLQELLDHMEELDDGFLDDALRAGPVARLIETLRFWLQSNSKRQARRNIAYHYDLGNDFYRLWLDETMTYSSGIFRSGQESLEAAQEAKYASMVDLMGAKPGDHVLEIGCGWGGFAEYAAAKRGLKVTGLTISKEQLDYAQDRIAKAGLQDRVTLKLQDYRDEQGRYDGIASIEMFEAVGQKYWPTYFDKVKTCLKPGAKATLQIITVHDRRWDSYRKGVDFIQKYIFPGGMLPAPKVLREEVERAGLRVEGSIEFGESYSQTLRRWHETFNEKWEAIAQQGFDNRFRRMWNLYLTSCAAAFHSGNCDVTQITITKPS